MTLLARMLKLVKMPSKIKIPGTESLGELFVRLDDLVVGQNHVVGVRVGGAAHQTYENHVAKLEPDVQYKGTLVIIVDYKKCDKYPRNI
jgi:hypothetical protein